MDQQEPEVKKTWNKFAIRNAAARRAKKMVCPQGCGHELNFRPGYLPDSVFDCRKCGMRFRVTNPHTIFL